MRRRARPGLTTGIAQIEGTGLTGARRAGAE
jgi:hypothetical protein